MISPGKFVKRQGRTGLSAGRSRPVVRPGAELCSPQLPAPRPGIRATLGLSDRWTPVSIPDMPSQDSFRLTRDPQGTLRFTDCNHGNVAVQLSPAFPLSEPGRWLAIRAADGTELALIEDPATLPADLRLVVDEELRTRQFVPIITRVHRASSITTGLEVAVETDRGPTTLLLDADEHIRRVSDTRVVLTDRAGVRYLIPDLRQLDQQSRNRLERFY